MISEMEIRKALERNREYRKEILNKTKGRTGEKILKSLNIIDMEAVYFRWFLEESETKEESEERIKQVKYLKKNLKRVF